MEVPLKLLQAMADMFVNALQKSASNVQEAGPTGDGTSGGRPTGIMLQPKPSPFSMPEFRST